MKSDIEIAQEAKMKPITEIAASLGLADEDVIPYGRYKAKINHRLIHKASKQGKMILVTAISPTPAGEGKTTTSVGLADAMNALGKKTMLCLREPSLGPVFGVKGGAAGGGYAQVVPMEDINLHFTGDIHAVTAANNLLSALIDNHIHQGNALRLDPERIVFRRCMDMNDRSLRKIEIGLGGKANGTPRFDGFQISVASEVMAILCLAKDLKDLREQIHDGCSVAVRIERRIRGQRDPVGVWMGLRGFGHDDAVLADFVLLNDPTADSDGAVNCTMALTDFMRYFTGRAIALRPKQREVAADLPNRVRCDLTRAEDGSYFFEQRGQQDPLPEDFSGWAAYNKINKSYWG